MGIQLDHFISRHFTHHTLRANGIRQHYLEAGDGPPVVLLLMFLAGWAG